MQWCPSLRVAFLAVVAAAATACSQSGPGPSAKPEAPPPAAAKHAAVARAPFGTLPDGTAVELFTLKNAGGMEVRVTNYGGIVTAIRTPDRQGNLGDVALGYDALDGYLKSSPYFGAIVGRYGNRIGKAQFSLDGRTYKLAANDGPNTLHGGLKGFDKAVWQAEPFKKEGEAGLVLTHSSPAGEEGFPGTLSMRVTYTLTDHNDLAIDYLATTDQPTVLNLTSHSYFNLAGEGSGDVLGHMLTINADRYTPVDATLIPTGELANVAGTPFDFRVRTAIGSRIDADSPQIKLGHGYDHNYVLNKQDGDLALAARVEEPTTGRVMEVRTTEPGMQFYSANGLDGTITGKSGRPYQRRGAFCLETQHFPDSPNKPGFPTTVLRPGQEFHSKTIYTFGTL